METKVVKMLHVRELCGNSITTNKKKVNFQEQYQKIQTSKPTVSSVWLHWEICIFDAWNTPVLIQYELYVGDWHSTNINIISVTFCPFFAFCRIFSYVFNFISLMWLSYVMCQIWKYQETMGMSDTALEHAYIDIQTQDGLTESEILLTGGLNRLFWYVPTIVYRSICDFFILEHTTSSWTTTNFPCLDFSCSPCI